MYTPAIDMEFCSGCIKVFIFQFPQRSAVHGVGIIRTEQLHIKMIGSGTHFLIRGKADPDLTMLFSGCINKVSAMVMISATPALSSAPSKVVPSVTIRSCPI